MNNLYPTRHPCVPTWAVMNWLFRLKVRKNHDVRQREGSASGELQENRFRGSYLAFSCFSLSRLPPNNISGKPSPLSKLAR
jgi:hypothetical protein